MCASPPQQPTKVTPPPRTRQHAGQLPQRPSCHTNASVLRGAAHAHTRVHPSARGGGREPVGVRRVQCTALGRPSALHSRACAVPHTPHRRSAAPCAPQGHTRVCAMHKQSSGGVGGGCVWGGAVLGVTAEGPAALRVPPPIWFAGGGADGRSHRMERRGRRAAVTLDPHHPPTPQHRRRGDHRGWEGCMGGEVTPLPLLSPPPRPSLAPGD